MNLETAINIGYSCQLLTDEMVDIFIVDGQNVEDVELQLIKCRESLRGYARSQVQTALSGIRYAHPHLCPICIWIVLLINDLVNHLVIVAIRPASAAKWRTWRVGQD